MPHCLSGSWEDLYRKRPSIWLCTTVGISIIRALIACRIVFMAFRKIFAFDLAVDLAPLLGSLPYEALVSAALSA